jgi:hypothetical protein
VDIFELEKQRLTQEIYDAFDGVTREGGISWGDATRKAIAHDEWMEEGDKPEYVFHGRDITWRDFHDYHSRWLECANEEERQSVEGYPDFTPELMARVDAQVPREAHNDTPFHDRDVQWSGSCR